MCLLLISLVRKDTPLNQPPPVRSDLPTRDSVKRQAARRAGEAITDQLDKESSFDFDDDTVYDVVEEESTCDDNDLLDINVEQHVKQLNRYHPVMKPIVKFGHHEKQLLKLLPLTTRLQYMQLNPKTPNTLSYVRYNGYKSSNNFREFLQNKGKREDLIHDMERGVVQIHAAEVFYRMPKYIHALMDSQRCDSFKTEIAMWNSLL